MAVRAGLLLALALVSATAPARDAHRADLAVLRDDYVQKGRAFTPETRRAALEHLALLEPRADSLTRAELLIAVAKTTALADNGHDSWHPGVGAWLPKRAPFRLFWFPDALVIARAAPSELDLLGARVTAIDGHSVDELFARLRPLAGGIDDYRRWNLTFYPERAEMLHALGLAASPDRLTLSLSLANGQQATREIEMLPRETAPHGASPGRLLSGAPDGDESQFGWTGVPVRRRTAVPAGSGPAVPDRGPARDRRELPSVPLAPRHNTESIEDFLRAAREHLAQSKPENLIVDLRFDGGGNIDPTVGFFNDLAATVPGRIYVIVSRLTFSAGIVAAALIEQSAGDRAMIVGEPVGDRLRFWSEGKPVCLPESKYCVQATDGVWDLVDGCAQEPGCYGDAFRVKVPDLEPDLAAPLTAGSWFAGTDPAMTAIEAHLWSCKSCRPESGDGD